MSRDRTGDDTRDAIRVGLIGAGKPAAVADLTARLGPRIRLSCIYEPVGFLAPLVAEAAGVPAVGSISHVAKRRGVQAAVVVNSGPLGLDICRPLLKENLPILWLDDAFQFAEHWKPLNDLDELATIVPACTHRYTGATLRLRELIAGDLGPVRQIATQVVDEPPASRKAKARGGVRASLRRVDWCRWITHPHVERRSETEWAFAASGKPPVTATVVSAAGDEAGPTVVTCQRGMAEVTDDSLRWRRTDDADWTDVDLSEERPALTVAADLFARRVIGGLVPVPLLDDIFTLLRAT